MKPIQKVFVFAAIILSITSCAGNKPQGSSDVLEKSLIPFVGTYKVNRFVLDNGLRILVVEDHTSPTFAYQTWFRVGSRDEVRGYTGLAHLFEHLMFKETKNYKDGEFDRLLESAGAEGENAFTSRDYTAYVQELPADKLDLIAKLESDRMVNLVVNDNSFKTEREVVQNERRFRNENNPDGLMYQDLFDISFNKHPYHWPVIGYEEDLNRMVAGDAMKFYKSYYSPNHATIIVVGDVDPVNVYETVRKYYGTISAEPSPIHVVEAEPEQKSAHHKVLKLNIQIEKILMGYHIPEMVSDDIPALMVLQQILTGGKSSRLYRALVETGIASSVDAYDLEDNDPSLLIFTANLQKEKKATQAEAVILRENSRLVQEPVSQQELDKTKNLMAFGFYDGLTADDGKARFLGHFEAIANDFQVGIKLYDRVLAVTPMDVQNVAKKYLQPGNRSVVTGVQKGVK